MRAEAGAKLSSRGVGRCIVVQWANGLLSRGGNMVVVRGHTEFLIGKVSCLVPASIMSCGSESRAQSQCTAA